jgi:hypothetical protein
MLTEAIPLPADCCGVMYPYAVEVPHWKYTIVDEPFAFTDPPIVALLEVTPLAAVVTTAGAAPPVIKKTSDP